MSRIIFHTWILLTTATAVAQVGNNQFFDEKYFFESKTNYVINDSLQSFDKPVYFDISSRVGDTVFISRDTPATPKEIATLFTTGIDKWYVGPGAHARVKFRDWDISPLTIPIKLRPKLITQPLQFQPDVAIGPYFGYQFGSKVLINDEMRSVSNTISIFCTPSLIDLDDQAAQSGVTDNVPGLSLGTGFLFDLNSNQFGLVCGWDFIGGVASESWPYQGKTWVSISMAFDLNK